MTIADSFTTRDLATVAAAAGFEGDGSLRAHLRLRPWAIHDILSDEAVFNTVMVRHDHPANVVSPALLFSVIAHRVAVELAQSEYVEDWAGPNSRLPVFDVSPLREFLSDPGRVMFLVRLLESFVVPSLPPVPADPLDLVDMASWVDVALPGDRAHLLRRLGDLALFQAGVFPDRVGSSPLPVGDAKKLGATLDLTADEVLDLCSATSMSPGLDALDHLGAGWYGAAHRESVDSPPVVSDVAQRFSSARRVLNVLSDRYLHQVETAFPTAA